MEWKQMIVPWYPERQSGRRRSPDTPIFERQYQL